MSVHHLPPRTAPAGPALCVDPRADEGREPEGSTGPIPFPADAWRANDSRPDHSAGQWMGHALQQPLPPRVLRERTCCDGLCQRGYACPQYTLLEPDAGAVAELFDDSPPPTQRALRYLLAAAITCGAVAAACVWLTR